VGIWLIFAGLWCIFSMQDFARLPRAYPPYLTGIEMELTNLTCKDCQTPNLRHARTCRACGESLGAVNVNIVSDIYFQEGLKKRYAAVLKEVSKRDKLAEVQRLEEAVEQKGQAVINMPLEILFKVVNESDAYLSYQRGVEQGKIYARAFNEEIFQCVIEGVLYGVSGKDVVYAALSLDDNGVSFYGDVSVVLKTQQIARRTTVFEKDTFPLYNELIESGWKPNKIIPSGHCGTWRERAVVVLIKHSIAVAEMKSLPDFARLILKSDDKDYDDDFIELHIWGNITKLNLEKVTLHKKASINRYDTLQFRILQNNLQKQSTTIAAGK
jgi:hypothetical protein